MKRYLPLLIIVGVALITAGAATMFYRAKMGAQVAAARPASSTASGTTAAVTPAMTPQTDAALAHARGPANAPVTLEMYGDFQCPPCAAASAAIDELMKDGDKVRLVFHEFPLAMHAHALEAAMAAEAAGQQGHFWEMHDMLYKYQDVWSKASNAARFFAGYAEALGLNPEQFQTDANSAQTKSLVMAEGDTGVQRGVRNTPTIIINGEEVKGIFTPESLRLGIDAALAKQGR
ncbi:MAG: DsbA family protein [Chthoniobacterales bacterium]